ncbi:UNVERIFIED_CONTAM: hypothetical protein FKN15_065314 [Acipenser sinensis]
MAGAQSDPKKWSMPGWRTEEKYSNKVLIGNWVEERLQGLPSRVLLTHHNTPNSDHLVSLYDEVYCRQGRNPALPPLRSWKYDSLAWVPERSDHPLNVNFGSAKPDAKNPEISAIGVK